MPYEVPSGDDIYFCVSLNSHDESVSIVQWVILFQRYGCEGW